MHDADNKQRRNVCEWPCRETSRRTPALELTDQLWATSSIYTLQCLESSGDDQPPPGGSEEPDHLPRAIRSASHAHVTTSQQRHGRVEHLNQTQLARRWKISPRTLERWRWHGIGPPFIKIGGRVVYRLEDIEAFEAQQRRASTSDRPGTK